VATGRWLRAARRDRRQSQRELAALANVPLSTVARIEAGKTVPRLDTFVLLLAALGFELAIVDRHGRLLELDDEHDRLRDRAGRRFPAHLIAGKTPSYADCFTGEGRTWWGWERIAWPYGPGTPPEYTFWQRPKYGAGKWGFLDTRRDHRWDDAT
jgi:transcriptional regulator with XRE-family HTH domain